MAEPLDSAYSLWDISNLLQEVYLPNFYEVTAGKGRTTNRLLSHSSEVVKGDGFNMQAEISRGDYFRSTTGALDPIAGPSSIEADKIKVRFDETDSSSNDFTRISGSIQFSHYTLKNGSAGSITDVVERTMSNFRKDYDEKMAFRKHTGRTARLALVNGTPKQNDTLYSSGATATPTNTTGARIVIDNGSIGFYRRGHRLDFYSSAGAIHAGNVVVTDVNQTDNSIGVAYTSSGSTNDLSSGNLGTIADNDEIFFSGERNKGQYSIKSWMTRPVTGDSFIGGYNRLTSAHRWMNTISTREGSTARQILLSDFDDAANAIGFAFDEENMTPFILTDPIMHNTLRRIIGEDAFIQVPDGDIRYKRFGNFGGIGLNYQHPIFGLVKIGADPLMTPNKVWILQPQYWRTYFWGTKGLEMLPANEGKGYFYRMQESTPNSGKGLVYKADAISNCLDMCFNPGQQAEIGNVTAS